MSLQSRNTHANSVDGLLSGVAPEAQDAQSYRRTLSDVHPQSSSAGKETSYVLVVGGRHLVLRERSIVGRSSDSDVCIPTDRRVSRRHARLTVCAHGVVIEDLGSKGGVFVDGERVRDGRLLLGGEHIRLGDTDIALVHTSMDGDGRLDFEEKTVVPESRAVEESGYFRTVHALPHMLEKGRASGSH